MESGSNGGRRSGALVVGGCLLAMYITAPGQTFVVSTFNDALTADLGLSAGELGLAYLIGTLCSAACLTAVGAAADRIGPRRMIAFASVGLALAGAGFGAAGGFATLTAAFFMLRVTGQGAISMASSHALALRFDATLGRMEGLRGGVVALAIASVPQVSMALIEGQGWRSAAVALGVTAGALGLFAAVCMIDRDPTPGSDAGDGASGWAGSFSPAEARRTPAYWILLLLVATQAAVVTGIHFHLLPILAEAGVSAVEAARTYMSYAAAGLVATLGGGVLADRFRPGPLLGASMGLLALGALALSRSSGTAASHLAMGVLGLAQGLGAATHGPTLARYFGRRHHGAIRGTAGTAAVVGSAVAPWAAGAAAEGSGSFTPALLMMGGLAGGLALLCGALRAPGEAPTDLP